jgi:glycosyltransferase involved in cell wall biosynthesis
MIKVLVLWSHHSGYLHGCLQELARYARIKAVFFEPSPAAPYSKQYFSDANYDILWLNAGSLGRLEELTDRLSGFDPDLCLCSGWHHKLFIGYVAKALRPHCVKALCFDWQWQPTLRNRLKAVYGTVYRSHFFDACFVSGERQYQFALRAGFSSKTIFQGLYAGSSSFAQPLPWSERSNRVVFVGRLVESKGCRFLATAWNDLQSRRLIPSSWVLDVYGVGPLDYLFSDLPRCKLHGFLQPDRIGCELGRAKILCAPSLDEPWGLQIHEGSIAGLAIIATDICGSAVHLVRSGFNGVIVPKADADRLGSAIQALVALDLPEYGQLVEHGYRSQMLSMQFTPALWAKTVLSIYSNMTAQSAAS